MPPVDTKGHFHLPFSSWLISVSETPTMGRHTRSNKGQGLGYPKTYPTTCYPRPNSHSCQKLCQTVLDKASSTSFHGSGKYHRPFPSAVLFLPHLCVPAPTLEETPSQPHVHWSTALSLALDAIFRVFPSIRLEHKRQLHLSSVKCPVDCQNHLSLDSFSSILQNQQTFPLEHTHQTDQ